MRALTAVELPRTKGGPAKALQRLMVEHETPEARRAWALMAENEAITGSCRLSLASVRTGIRRWSRFAVNFLGLERPYPAPLYGLLAYSKTFRCADVYTNYLGYARVGCLLCREPDDAFDAKVLKRAKVGILMRARFCCIFRHAPVGGH